MSIHDKLSARKAAIYIRVSTHWQVDKDSLKVQERELTAYCQMVLGINDYVVFTDPGYSAKNTDRPDYQAMSASADRRRANGFRPSQYACSSRRRQGTTCTNKYISDLTVGSFVLNYAANIIRATRNSPADVQPDVLERKLLRGVTFDDVESINSEAIQQLLSSFAEAGDAVEYRPQYAFTSASGEGRDIDNLRARKRKLETALSRLNALFLYDDEAMPEKDFIVERTNIERQLAETDKRIAELAATGLSSSEDSSDFLKKASYFIMVNKLIEDASVDYEKLVRTLDPAAIRDFVLSIVQEVEATDGKITAITFRNGTVHRFKYKA